MKLEDKKVFKAWSKIYFDERVLTYWAPTCWRYSPSGEYLHERLLTLGMYDPLKMDYRHAHIIITLFFAIEETHPNYFPNNSPEGVYKELIRLLREERYHRRFKRLLEKNIGVANYPKYHLKPEDAFKELAMRGFLPYSLLGNKIYMKERCYLHGMGKQLFIPLPDGLTPTELAEYQKRLGISGHTGYNYPLPY